MEVVSPGMHATTGTFDSRAHQDEFAARVFRESFCIHVSICIVFVASDAMVTRPETDPTFSMVMTDVIFLLVRLAVNCMSDHKLAQRTFVADN